MADSDIGELAADLVREVAVAVCLFEGGGASDNGRCGYRMKLNCEYQSLLGAVMKLNGDLQQVKYGCNYRRAD